MFIIFNCAIRSFGRRVSGFVTSLLIICCILGFVSEKNINNEEYEIYTEVLKYIHEFDDLKYQKLSHIILNEITIKKETKDKVKNFMVFLLKLFQRLRVI